MVAPAVISVVSPALPEPADPTVCTKDTVVSRDLVIRVCVCVCLCMLGGTVTHTSCQTGSFWHCSGKVSLPLCHCLAQPVHKAHDSPWTSSDLVLTPLVQPWLCLQPCGAPSSYFLGDLFPTSFHENSYLPFKTFVRLWLP